MAPESASPEEAEDKKNDTQEQAVVEYPENKEEDEEDEPDNETNDEDEEEEDDDDDEDEENIMSRLPAPVVKRVEELQALDKERESIMEQYTQERAVLERRYAKLFEPLYQKRKVIVQGQDDNDTTERATTYNGNHTDSNSEQQQQQQHPDQPATDSPGNQREEGEAAGSNGAAVAAPDEEVAVAGIPHFWVTALSNHDTVGEIITEDDVDCLEHLQDVTCVDDDKGQGFCISFHFQSNPYFSNTVLTKTYQVPNLLLSDEPLLKHVTGCTIDWRDDEHCLTFRRFQKKQRGKGKKAGQIRTVTKTEKKESFFHWFTPPPMPTNQNIETMDEEEVEEMEEQFTDDFEIAQALRGEVCPRAVLWFTGQVRIVAVAVGREVFLVVL